MNSLRNWFYNHEGAIYAKEQSYIDKDDLFPLIPKERSPLRRLFETSSRFRLSHFWKREKLAGTISDLPVHCHENIQLYSDKKIDDFVTFTTVFTGLVMLIAPIWILAYTHPVAAKLAIITAFILFFLALVSFGTNSKPFESLAATAAYLSPQSSNIYMHRGAALMMIIGTRLSLWSFCNLEVITKTGFGAQVVF